MSNMIDREKVTAAIDECLKTDVFKCEDCPYLGKQADVLSCVGVLMKDASELLKADQTYLQERDEKIKKLHLLLNAKLSAQPLIQKLTERLQRIADIAGDYDNYPTRNGLEWVCIEIQEIAMSGLQEVKND